MVKSRADCIHQSYINQNTPNGRITQLIFMTNVNAHEIFISVCGNSIFFYDDNFKCPFCEAFSSVTSVKDHCLRRKTNDIDLKQFLGYSLLRCIM